MGTKVNNGTKSPLKEKSYFDARYVSPTVISQFVEGTFGLILILTPWSPITDAFLRLEYKSDNLQ